MPGTDGHKPRRSRRADGTKRGTHTNAGLADHAHRLAALFSRATPQALVDSLRTFDGQRTPEASQARGWLIGELERRFPAASAAVGEAFDAAADDEPVDYVGVLTAAVERELAAAAR